MRELARELGIDKVGVAPADKLPDQAFRTWLGRGYQASMSYMERNLDKRANPSLLLEGAQSVISVFVNYYESEFPSKLEGHVSRYAAGEDYHHILKDKLYTLAHGLMPSTTHLTKKEQLKHFRVFVDSAPVMEKEWAVRAGIGWQGKHSNVITRDFGSWGFLGEIITVREFDTSDTPHADFCGSCTACLDACPTNAIVEPYVVDAAKCISHATIELGSEEAIPSDVDQNREEWIFGCDICQDVCPWNRFSRSRESGEFAPLEVFQEEGIPDFTIMSESEFHEKFGSSPLARPGLAGMRRNQRFKS